MIKLFLLLLSIFACQYAAAEVYRDIQPFTSLAELRSKFPGATFRTLKTAWIKEEESIYEVTGAGLQGKILIKMTDSSFEFKKYIADHPEQDISEEVRSLATPNEKLSIIVGWSDWVRYVPDRPFPVGRLLAKYGNPEASGFSDDDFSPYKSWPSKGVSAFLTDDFKNVSFVEYRFTLSEGCAAYERIAKNSADRCISNKSTPKESKSAPSKK